MMTISKSQMGTISAGVTERFVRLAVARLRELFRHETHGLDGKSLEDFVRRGITESGKLEIKLEVDVQRFLDLYFHIGKEFASLLWVRKILDDTSVSAMDRLDGVYSALYARRN